MRQLSSKEPKKKCSECRHWKPLRRKYTTHGCSILRKAFCPASSACFMADMTLDEIVIMGEFK